MAALAGVGFLAVAALDGGGVTFPASALNALTPLSAAVSQERDVVRVLKQWNDRVFSAVIKKGPIHKEVLPPSPEGIQVTNYYSIKRMRNGKYPEYALELVRRETAMGEIAWSTPVRTGSVQIASLSFRIADESYVLDTGNIFRLRAKIVIPESVVEDNVVVNDFVEKLLIALEHPANNRIMTQGDLRVTSVASSSDFVITGYVKGEAIAEYRFIGGRFEGVVVLGE